MVVIGIDAHKRTHTAVVIDSNGRKLGIKTCETATVRPSSVRTTSAHCSTRRCSMPLSPAASSVSRR
ncbi:hypothetical protein ACQP00_28710 [Dactylosporangium sp. CS-047395]|uniref:hypothetical protein n=1 Tax=Dactylosporangium sp. CS-047395 TaxID=3239936 RepID=UPI003D91C18A